MMSGQKLPMAAHHCGRLSDLLNIRPFGSLPVKGADIQTVNMVANRQ